MAFQLLTGSSLGIYYYVFVMVCCIALVWPLARLPVTALWCIWLGLLALSFAMTAGWIGRGTLFVSMRNPFDHFYLGFFLTGWLVALSWPRIETAYQRAPVVWGALCAAAIGYGWAVQAGWAAAAGALTRPVYTFGVIGAIAMLSWRRPPGTLVRFLSEASLYLYHRILQRLVEPAVAGWHPGLRIALLVAVGLGPVA